MHNQTPIKNCSSCYWHAPNFSLLYCRLDGKPVAANDGVDCLNWKDEKEYEKAWQSGVEEG